MNNKRHMTFSMKNVKLLDSDPSNYTATEKQYEVDDSPPKDKEFEFKDEPDTPPKKRRGTRAKSIKKKPDVHLETAINEAGNEDEEESEYKPRGDSEYKPFVPYLDEDGEEEIEEEQQEAEEGENEAAA